MPNPNAKVERHRRSPTKPTTKPRGAIAPDALTPLLYTRRQACRLLNVSQATLIRMEQRGVLKPRKLYQAQNGMTYYSRDDLERLAQGGDDE